MFTYDIRKHFNKYHMIYNVELLITITVKKKKMSNEKTHLRIMEPQNGLQASECGLVLPLMNI